VLAHAADIVLEGVGVNDADALPRRLELGRRMLDVK
jgi:hypothetical protein